MYFLASGRGPGYTIQVDWSWGRGFLDSARVEIDGAVVGVLEPYGGQQYVAGFRVEAGSHVVRVLQEGCEGIPDTVRLDARSSRIAVLMVDVDDSSRCRVILR